jgi:hypothetical protein
MGRKIGYLVLGVLVLLLVCNSALAQNAQVSGQVTDPQHAAIAGAEVRVVNQATGVERKTTTNEGGFYSIPFLEPGRYKIFVQASGFSTAVNNEITLSVGQVAMSNFELKVGSAVEHITVSESSQQINTTDASVSTVVNRQFVENIPLNGRSFQSLIALTPGIVNVPGGFTGAFGEFSVNGQRTQANAFYVDGVSVNTGAAPTGGLAYSNGSTPSETALGTTHSMVSIDAVEEFRIDTSTYSAQFGRFPGAQISFQTRSGTNMWHGSAYDYLRNTVFDSNNWFNNAAGLPKPAERQNDFGGVIGGPIEIPHVYDGKDRTFFFFSYEGLRLTVPQPAFSIDVPDAALRANSPAAIQPILNAFPVAGPNAPDDTANGIALYTGTFSTPSSVDSYSIKVDHTFGPLLKVFGRYSDAPSHSLTRSTTEDPANVNNTYFSTRTVTIGATSVFSPRFSNDFRFNYTKANSGYIGYLDNFGGAVPLTEAQLFPTYSPPASWQSAIFFEMGTTFGFDVAPFQGYQHQWNITDTVSTTFGAHTLKYGFDFRRQTTTFAADTYVQEYVYYTAAQVLANTDTFSYIEGWGPAKTGVFTNYSAFIQDEWKATNRLHLSLGLRWDINPPPGTANGPRPYTVDQVTNVATSALAPAGTLQYPTDWHGFGPRIGVAYQLHRSANHDTVVRGGFGVYYDVGNWPALINFYGGVGFGSSAEYIGTPFPVSTAQATLPAPSTAPPYNGTVGGFGPNFTLPLTMQWNVAVEQGLGSSQTLTLSYVAAAGRNLLSEQFLSPYGTNPNFGPAGYLYVFGNLGDSNYNSLQAQFQRSLSHGLQTILSYTWSHAIDNVSFDQYLGAFIRGNADFDLRHNFAAAVTYDVPGTYSNAFAGAILKHWSLDLRETAHSALPVYVDYGYTFVGTRELDVIPNYNPSVPLYVYGSQYPGGKAINYNAFSAPPAGENGDSPRNFVRGFGAVQTDLAIRREFPLHERLKLQFRAESFNLFNHPNFGQIYSTLTDGPALFGRAEGTLNNQLGGLNPLYQVGGPRSLQMALKLIF